jgi:hypothetical protein
VALKLVKGIAKVPAQSQGQKSREELLVTCLREERNDPRFSDWEKNFITSLARQVDHGRKLTDRQKEILERIWKK